MGNFVVEEKAIEVCGFEVDLRNPLGSLLPDSIATSFASRTGAAIGKTMQSVDPSECSCRLVAISQRKKANAAYLPIVREIPKSIGAVSCRSMRSSSDA